MLKDSLHPNTAAMLQAWKRITKSPTNVDGGPSAYEYPGLLGRLFIIETTREDFYPFRIAGEHLTGLLGRNLIGTDFLDLWARSDRVLVRALLESVSNGDRPGLLRGFGETSHGRRLETEIAVAPLKGSRQQQSRLLCLYQTLGGEAMLQDRSIWTHRVRGLYPPEPVHKEKPLRLVVSNHP